MQHCRRNTRFYNCRSLTGLQSGGVYLQNHVRLLGILFIIWGILSIVFGLIIFGLFLGGGFLTGDEEAFAVLSIIGVIVGAFCVVTGIPEIIGGWGLLRKMQWARIVVLIMAVFNVINPPLGTALGVYAFWVLFNPDCKAMLT